MGRNPERDRSPPGRRSVRQSSASSPGDSTTRGNNADPHNSHERALYMHSIRDVLIVILDDGLGGWQRLSPRQVASE